MARLREALRDAPAAARVVIRANDNSTAVAEGTAKDPAGVATLPISDTVKEVVDGMVRRTVPRETLVEVIGPWVFDRDVLADALTRVAGAETKITDLIGLYQTAHLRVHVLPAR